MRPHDIPRQVWEEAENFSHEHEVTGCSVREVAARVIIAERERCAKIADDECARVLSKQNGRNYDVDANLRLIAVLLPDIAAAIRKGGLQ